MKNTTKNKQQRRKLKRTLRRRVKRGGSFLLEKPSKYQLEIIKLLSGVERENLLVVSKKIESSKLLNDEEVLVLTEILKLLPKESFNEGDLTQFIHYIYINPELQNKQLLAEILKNLPDFNSEDLIKIINEIHTKLQYKEQFEFLEELIRIIHEMMKKPIGLENIIILIALIKDNQITPLPLSSLPSQPPLPPPQLPPPQLPPPQLPPLPRQPQN